MKNNYLNSVLALVAAVLAGCSAYESEGRKYLEKQAFEFAGVTANVTACGYSAVDGSWALTEQSGQTDTYISENQEFLLRIQTTVESAAQTPAYGCEFQFDSAQEMSEKSADAVGLTLYNYSALPKTR